MPKCVSYYQFVSRQIGERPLEGAQQTFSAWSRAGSRPPLRGASRPGCPAFGGASVVCSALAPRRLVGPLRAQPGGPASPPGFAPGGAPGPCRGRWPRPGPSAPFGSLRGRSGLSAGRLRPSARPRPSPGGPRCGVAGSGPRRPCLAGGSAPGSGVWAGGLLSLAAPCRGRCAPAAARPAPLPRRAGSPSPGPCRAARLPPWAAAPPPSGGGWGRLRRPFPRRRPLRGGRSCWCRGGRSLGPGARANPSHPPSRVKTSGASAALDGVCAGWQAVTKGATSRPVIRQAFHSGVDIVEQTCYYRACKGVPQPLALRCP